MVWQPTDLEDSERLYRSVVELMPLPILVHQEGAIIYANEAAVHALRAADQAALVGTPVLDIVHPDFREVVRQRIVAVVQGNAPVPVREERFLRLDGSTMDVEVAATSLQHDGAPRLVVAFRDITGHNQAVAALREVQERMQAVIQHAPLILYVLDREGRFVLSEGRELAQVGRVAGEVVGKTIDEVFGHLPDRLSRLRRVLAGEAFTAEVLVDGVWFEAHHQPLFDADGAVSGAVVVSVNITERKHAEESLQETERHLATVMAHAPVVVFTLDSKGIVTFATGKGLEAVGMTSQQVMGTDYFALVADHAVVTENMRQALEGQTVQNVGTFANRTFQTWLQPQFDESGAVVRVLALSLDITARVAAEAALRTSEARFRDFAEASSDWLWETDEDDRLTYLSPGFERITGNRAAQYLRLRRREISADEENQARWQHYEQLLAAHLPLRDFYYSSRRIGGQLAHFRINGLPVYDDSGAFRGYRGTATDVTDQMRTQEALRASEERFRQLVEGSLQGVMVVGEGWRLIFANQAAADIFGYANPAELLGVSSGADLVAPEDREWMSELRAARVRGEPRAMHYEYRGLRKDGRIVWLQTFVRVVDWNGQQVVQVTLVDITEQKAAAEELRRTEQNFRRLIEHMDMATLIFDTDWRPLFVNPAAARLFGYELPESFLGAVHNGRELIYEEDRSAMSHPRHEHLGGRPGSSRAEFRALRRDGQLLWLESFSSAVEWEGKPASMTVSLDVTAHKLREEQLRQAQKMEVVGQLTGGVAHDFNNLLTVVMGNQELLRRRIGDDPVLGDLLGSATAAAERGATLTQRLLAFSRKQALKPEAVDLNRLITGLTELLRRTLGETIEVETVLAGGLWPALVDPNQLENALLNLAINARDAMPTGGKLTIETANARLDDEYATLNEEVHPGQYVMMAVSDTGQGMNPEVLEHAFEPFFTTKEVGRGSGLGLSMIYGFIKQSNGHVKIYSEPDQGTTVKLYLPRQVAPLSARQQEAALRVNPLGHGETVLVVEDDAAVRELALAIVHNLGYTPIAAEDGPQGLEQLQAHPETALLFTDVVLPGAMGGVELAREARRRKPVLKVLYTSGYTENAIIHHGRLDEGVELLEKPYRIETLARKLRTVLDED